MKREFYIDLIYQMLRFFVAQLAPKLSLAGYFDASNTSAGLSLGSARESGHAWERVTVLLNPLLCKKTLISSVKSVIIILTIRYVKVFYAKNKRKY
jgi:hypothetical protein